MSELRQHARIALLFALGTGLFGAMAGLAFALVFGERTEGILYGAELGVVVGLLLAVSLGPESIRYFSEMRPRSEGERTLWRARRLLAPSPDERGPQIIIGATLLTTALVFASRIPKQPSGMDIFALILLADRGGRTLMRPFGILGQVAAAWSEPVVAALALWRLRRNPSDIWPILILCGAWAIFATFSRVNRVRRLLHEAKRILER